VPGSLRENQDQVCVFEGVASRKSGIRAIPFAFMVNPGLH
jgi:hypothetical protein